MYSWDPRLPQYTEYPQQSQSPYGQPFSMGDFHGMSMPNMEELQKMANMHISLTKELLATVRENNQLLRAIHSKLSGM